MIVGGGYVGSSSRQFGLVVDYLTGVDVVCVSRHGQARLVRARKGDPETGRLLWAHTGGGGGNFGIVTAYYFTGLPNPPEQVRVAITTWQWAQLSRETFATLLRNFGNFMQANSAPSSPYARLFALLHANHVSAGRISLTTCQVATPRVQPAGYVPRAAQRGHRPKTGDNDRRHAAVAPGHRVARRVRSQPAREVQVLVYEGAVP